MRASCFLVEAPFPLQVNAGRVYFLKPLDLCLLCPFGSFCRIDAVMVAAEIEPRMKILHPIGL